MQSYKSISEGVQWRCVHVCTGIAVEELKGEKGLHNVLKGRAQLPQIIIRVSVTVAVC